MPRHSRPLAVHIRSGSVPLLVVGVPNALTARVAEDVGCAAAYVSGAGLTNTLLGAPDVGLLTLTELASSVALIRDAVSLPLIVDADTGFGNAVNTYRAVRTLERAGADAIQIEDQVSPKRCGHFAGKSVTTSSEMIGKIHAATDARVDDDVLIIARTDALADLGLDEACDRAATYLQEGADVAFVEAPRTWDELTEIPMRVGGPLIVNMVEGGATPIVPIGGLGLMGYSMVLYANTAMRAGIAAMADVLTHLHEHGDTLALTDRITPWQERQRLVRKPFYDELEARYAAAEGRANAGR